MALHPVAGGRIYIGAAAMDDQADDFVEADFSGVTWTEIDGWQTAGRIGDTSQLISTDLINRGRTIKQKGTRNAGSMGNTFAIIGDDPGQLALIAAEATDDNYPFRLVWPNGETQYFIGLVMSAAETNGQANTIRVMEATVEVNSNIVTVTS